MLLAVDNVEFVSENQNSPKHCHACLSKYKKRKVEVSKKRACLALRGRELKLQNIFLSRRQMSCFGKSNWDWSLNVNFSQELPDDLFSGSWIWLSDFEGDGILNVPESFLEFSNQLCAVCKIAFQISFSLIVPHDNRNRMTCFCGQTLFLTCFLGTAVVLEISQKYKARDLFALPWRWSMVTKLSFLEFWNQTEWIFFHRATLGWDSSRTERQCTDAESRILPENTLPSGVWPLSAGFQNHFQVRKAARASDLSVLVLSWHAKLTSGNDSEFEAHCMWPNSLKFSAKIPGCDPFTIHAAKPYSALVVKPRKRILRFGLLSGIRLFRVPEVVWGPANGSSHHFEKGCSETRLDSDIQGWLEIQLRFRPTSLPGSLSKKKQE